MWNLQSKYPDYSISFKKLKLGADKMVQIIAGYQSAIYKEKLAETIISIINLTLYNISAHMAQIRSQLLLLKHCHGFTTQNSSIISYNCGCWYGNGIK